jgi:hypothetical protein
MILLTLENGDGQLDVSDGGVKETRQILLEANHSLLLEGKVFAGICARKCKQIERDCRSLLGMRTLRSGSLLAQ